MREERNKYRILAVKLLDRHCVEYGGLIIENGVEFHFRI
jgi:hypothetical protein